MKKILIRCFLIFILAAPFIFRAGLVQAVSDGEGNEIFPDSNVGVGTTMPSSLFEVGSRQFNVTSAGNVGIGTGVPGAMLDVVDGAVRIMSDPATATVDHGGQPGTLYIQGDFEVDGKIYGDGSGLTNLSSSQWTTGGDGIYYNAGNVGIGTTELSDQLTVYDPSANAVIRIPRSDVTSISTYLTHGAVGTVGTDPLEIYANSVGLATFHDSGYIAFTPTTYLSVNSDQLYINVTSGNVGIGTEVPLARLHVGTGTPGVMPITGRDLYVSGNIEFDGRIYGDGSALTNLPAGSGTVNPGAQGYFSYYPAAGTTVDDQTVLYTDGTNIGIGSSAPQEKLDIRGHLRVGGAIFAEDNIWSSSCVLDEGVSCASTDVNLGAGYTAGQTRIITFSTNNGGAMTERGRVTANGNFGIGTTAPLALLQVGIDPSVPAGSAPAVAVNGNLVVDGKIYGDGSALTGLSAVTNWDAIGDPSGSGSIAMGATAQAMDWATATTQNALTLSGNALTSGTLLNISSNGTGALTGQKGLNIALAGNNASATQTTYGAYISNTHAGATSTNVALYAAASGGTAANYAAIFNGGNVGVGTTAPASTLEIAPGGTLALPQGTAPVVSKAGQVAVDLTDDQLVYYGAAKRVLPYERTVCVTVENLAAADDDFGFMSLPDNATLARGWCHCQGTCTTEATITLETVQIGTAGPTVDAVGGTITCTDLVAGASATTLTADNTVDALDLVRFNVTNTPAPTTDKYTVCVAYTFDAQ